MIDQVFESVAALGCGGQTQPVACGDSAQNGEEGFGRDVVAFVDDDESVVGGEFFDVVPAGKGGKQGDIQDSGSLRPSAADLAAFEVQVLVNTVALLVGQGLAVDQDESGSGA